MCDAAGVFASTWQTRAVGVLIGCLLDVVFGDPKRGHPVALFGRAAAKLEQITYRDGRVIALLRDEGSRTRSVAVLRPATMHPG